MNLANEDKGREKKMQDKNVTTKGVETSKIAPQKILEEETNVVQLIVFTAGEQEFGAKIGQIREIIDVGRITPIPDSPDYIKGVTNVRGEITVAIDPKALFFLRGNHEVESKHIVITEQEENLFGLMVDEVIEVLRIPETEIKPPPELVAGVDRKYISGLVTLENRLVVMLDLAEVLSEKEFVRWNEVFRSHQVAGDTEGGDGDKTLKKEEEILPEPRSGVEDAKSPNLEGGEQKKKGAKGNKRNAVQDA